MQATCLMLVTIGTLVYTLYKEHIRTYQVTNLITCVAIGIFLGILPPSWVLEAVLSILLFSFFLLLNDNKNCG